MALNTCKQSEKASDLEMTSPDVALYLYNFGVMIQALIPTYISKFMSKFI